VLDELRIRGLGVIDEAVLPLGPGLTVVTGETGAGKTMVVTSLLLLFGGRADPARVRGGADQASVEGRVLLPAGSPAAGRVAAAGGELDDGDLLLRRVVSAAGRSRAYVGGTAAPAAVLGDLAEHLLIVHGQADQLRLVRPGAQRAALDRYAGVDTAPLAEAYAVWRAAVSAYDERTGRAAELRRETDLLTHGIAEIEAVDPQPGEADELTRLAARLAHADALTLAARTAHDTLLGVADDPVPEAADVSTLLGAAARALTQQQGEDPELDALAARLGELASLTGDLGAEFGAYADQLDADPERLARLEERRAALTGLVRKYCDEPEPSVDGVLRWAEAARDRLASIDVSDAAIDALRAERDAAAGRLAAVASAVSAARHTAAAQLAEAVTAELAGLAMSDARVDVVVEPRPPASGTPLTIDGAQIGVTADGIDEVTFLLRPHPGSPALPLTRGASGGELSRVMLALEVCLIAAGEADTGATLVFDEVDAGVGGRAAVEVGRRLARLARGRQVLVVTHLAQVAAFADRHVVVDKPAAGAQRAVTASDVHPVDGDDRLAELARMLSGSDTPTAREHAAELLAESATPVTGVADVV